MVSVTHPPFAARFWGKVEKTDSCWLWTGLVSTNGYGRFADQPAHRVAYELANEPVPDGLVLDHLCRVRTCVNPDHLEAVTQTENILRGIGPTAKNARKTICDAGHDLDAANTYVYEGDLHRRCRACHNERCREYRARKRAEREAA